MIRTAPLNPAVCVLRPARVANRGAGETEVRYSGFLSGTSSFLSRRPNPQSEFLLAPNQDDEGDDAYDELTDVHEQCCQCHKRTVPLSRRLRFR